MQRLQDGALGGTGASVISHAVPVSKSAREGALARHRPTRLFVAVCALGRTYKQGNVTVTSAQCNMTRLGVLKMATRALFLCSLKAFAVTSTGKT